MLKNLMILVVCTALACAAAFGLVKYNEFRKTYIPDGKTLTIETLNDIILGKGQTILKEESFALEGFDDILVQDISMENYRILKTTTSKDELSILVEDLTNRIGYIINDGVLEKIIDLKDIQSELTPEKVMELANEEK